MLDRRLDESLTTSDLCVAAAEQLIVDLGMNKVEVEGLIFEPQITDNYLPATA